MYDREQGGGYLAGMLVHALDFVPHLLGRPVEVRADVRTCEPERQLSDGRTLAVTADDTAAVLLRFESGALCVLSVSVVGSHADHYRLELLGAEGTIIGDGTLRLTAFAAGRPSDEALALLLPAEREPAHPEQLPERLAGHASRAKALMLEDWIPAFRGGATKTPTFEDGLLSLAIVDAAQPLSDDGGRVQVEA